MLGALLAAPLVVLNGGPSEALAAPAADQALVKAMFATGRLSALADDQGEPLASLRAYANGTVSSHVVANQNGIATTTYCTLDHAILQGLHDVIVKRGFSLRVSSINRLCERDYALKPSYYSLHWENGGGHAVDVDKINGQTAYANRTMALRYINAMIAVMPPNTGVGQLSCWPGVSLPSTWFAVPDNCNSVHIEYRGTDQNWTAPTSSPYDYDGDAKDDVFAVRNDGYLFMYTGSAGAGFVPRQVSTGWNAMPNVLHGDYSGDGRSDLVASDLYGTLWFYPGNGAGGWDSRQRVGSGWESMSLVTGGADDNGDGIPDVIARRPDNTLWLFKGDGIGGFPASQQVGTGWGGMRSLISGDFNGDGKGDLEAIDGAGTLWFYPGNGAGGWGAPRSVGSGWNAMDLITGGGDYDGDGKADLIGRRNSDSSVVLARGDGTGTFSPGIPLNAPGADWTTVIKLI